MDRQAARAVQQLLQADASGRGGASIKSLTLAPSIEAKKATHAVTCQTLKLLPVLKQLLEGCPLLQQHPQLQPETAYVLVYEVLFGEGLRRRGPAEKAIMAAKGDLNTLLQDIKTEAGALQQSGMGAVCLPFIELGKRICRRWRSLPMPISALMIGSCATFVRWQPATSRLSSLRELSTVFCAGVEDVEALLSAEVQRVHEQQRPRTARVNTLKMAVADAVAWLSSPPPEHSSQSPQVPHLLHY